MSTPRLNPNQTGWYSIYLPQRDGRLSWTRWLVTCRDGLPARRRSITHPSTNRAQCRLTTVDQIQRANRHRCVSSVVVTWFWVSIVQFFVINIICVSHKLFLFLFWFNSRKCGGRHSEECNAQFSQFRNCGSLWGGRPASLGTQLALPGWRCPSGLHPPAGALSRINSYRVAVYNRRLSGSHLQQIISI